jgi:hypothetical protein
MRSQSTCAHNGRQADSQDSPHSLHALVQEQIGIVRALLDRALEHDRVHDIRYCLRLLCVLQQAEQQIARVGRNLPNVNWP